MASSKLSGAVVHTPKGFKKVAACKAVNNALDQTSLPAVLECVPGGFDGAKVKAKIATPNPKGVNEEEVKKCIPYSKTELKIVHGGMRWHSGLIIPALGDPPPEQEVEAATSDDEDAPITSNDEFIAAVAAVRIGY